MAFFGEAFGASMEQSVPDFHPDIAGKPQI
jgi:hypothetical protein